jgi:dienelactone hydrolase
MEMVKDWYGRRMRKWEHHLATRSTNRVVRPFDWGGEWAEKWPVSYDRGSEDIETYLRNVNTLAIRESDRFFSYETPKDFRVEGDILKFTSPVDTPYPENNTVHAHLFPAEQKPGKRKRAVVVLPHWNASLNQHMALAKGIAKFGMTALRMSLPYHDYRMPPELERADYAMSSNVARSIDATRQAVVDVRATFDWLQQQGYESLGLVGTSIGSCYAFLASAHDERIAVNVFNHCSTYVADVVWSGLSTKHIRAGIEQDITLERLREAWACISPVHYMDRFAAQKKKSLFVYATYDTTFPLHLSKDTVSHIRKHQIDAKIVEMPCGHYTIGEAPFKFIDGYHIVSFLRRWL